jgi:hypothetical protein
VEAEVVVDSGLADWIRVGQETNHVAELGDHADKLVAA